MLKSFNEKGNTMRILLTFFLIVFTGFIYAQDSIQHRIILIGDAGEIDNQQNNVITKAAQQIIGGKTTVVYLGDNVYPTGMGLPGSEEEKQTQQILQAQFQPMRSNNAAVYFVPGNHDWDRMGKLGLEKIKAQWNFIQSQHDNSLQLLPPNGCPDPVAIDINEHLVIIAFDSEWWLFQHNKKDSGAHCKCNNNDDVINEFQQLFYNNRFKTILLADHHPFKSYGHHGDYYGWKDNIFPLTAINKNLYIPLPVVGSLYPLLRKAFANPEDAGHPLYKEMTGSINSVFDTFPNLIHASGHEHGMQFIKNGNFTQIVSGAGAKHNYVTKGKYSMFAKSDPGFVVADQLTNNNIQIHYYTSASASADLKNSFSYTLPYTPVQQQEEQAMLNAPKDSFTVAAHSKYDSVTNIHRHLFGENYRKEWAAPTTLPVIKLTDIKGGLTPTERGGGHQSKSLRLMDKDSVEYVLRSVNKYPEVLLPEGLRRTFAAEWVNDAMSAQHPYSALVVPVLADAAEVPHTHPMIGYVVPDEKLGMYNSTFQNTVNLLEEREPLGSSDNTEKTLETLTDDNDNNLDSAVFLRARLLDMLINDWDRHNDQWRFADKKNEYGGKTYIAVPRDRDQVFYINQGLFPWISIRPWNLWFMQDYKNLRSINDYMWESRFLNSRFLNQFSYDEWMKITNDFVAKENDSVLEAALRKLPASSYNIRHDDLLKRLKDRRADIPREMKQYYRFINKIVDLQFSDKNELVEFSDTLNNNLLVSVFKLSKEREIKQRLFYKSFDPSLTKEIRLYVNDGDDSVVFNTNNNNIKIRVIGKKGDKSYNVEQVSKSPIIYNREKNISFSGSDAGKLHKHLSSDSANTAFVPTDLYNRIKPVLTGGFNNDDGIIAGAGFKYTQKGFRKIPWASEHDFMVRHSFSTKAFGVDYSGEWKDVLGKTDILVNAFAKAPDNTQNFFGAGNETVYNKTGNYKRFYRARFNLYSVNTMLRWNRDPKPTGNPDVEPIDNIYTKFGTHTSFSIGPAFQFYRFDAEDNEGRLIVSQTHLNIYDSATLQKDKAHLGVEMLLASDKRNNRLIPSSGYYFEVKLQGYKGLNNYSNSYGQLLPQAAVYQSLTSTNSVVIADRLGGGITVGKPAFYQLLFLDGQDNLMGYRRYRFAGKHMLYNNLELRIKLADVASFVLPGQLGLTAFYDIGRVWIDDDNSEKWHNGVGGGLYFAPAHLFLVRASFGYSSEGWYPTVGFNFRF